MPKILTVSGYRILIYTNDHRPAHVHVEGPDGSCTFWLNCPDGPIELREVRKLTLTLVRRLGRDISTAITMLCNEWGKIHGQH